MASVTAKARRTPLGKARGLGAAKQGVGHFIAQRGTALALVVLVPWFLISLVTSMQAGYQQALDWIGAPFNAVALLLLLLAAFWHMRLGLQVVIEDYLRGWGRVIALVANTFVSIAAMVASIYAVLRISFGV